MKKVPKEYWELFRLAQQKLLPLIRQSARPGLLNPVFGIPLPKDSPAGPEPSASERYWLRWFQEGAEIDSSRRRLDQALAYLSHGPKSRALHFHGLSEADWVRYHVEVYLQETYILFERLKHLLRGVQKVATRGLDKEGLGSVKRLRRVLDDTLSAFVKARGSHVHERRFQDEGLKNLDTLVLLTGAGKMRKLRTLRKAQHIAVLRKWQKQLLANNRVILALCTTIFQGSTAILARHEPSRPGAGGGAASPRTSR
jgi:hypothetical protein